ncbi:MAG: L-aspartate oxidase [Acutalibacteraceae bacterium]|nr:L-aspartate oxidase [Acutalibacteraceae bacterium]
MKNNYDVVIIGSGVAGLYSALQFDEKYSVLVISKKSAELSNSSLAQGGIAAVLDKTNDDFKLHIEDTMIAGKYKNNPKAVEVLVSEGPSDVVELYKLGVDFDLDNNGEMQKTLEAGHSRHRIVHHKDSTGKAVTDKLIEIVRTRRNIDFLENTFVFSLDKAKNGFYVGMLKDEKIETVSCSYCILATGGIGRVYKYTTNSAIATGDGIAFARRLGAKIMHLDRIQFHPTAFAAEKDRERFLISEAVRGEGAVLLNCFGERFAHNYDSRGELAPRDVVSEAVVRESIRTKSEDFYLDITHKSPEFVRERFPMIYSKCLEEGIDITTQRIPVFPCQHYLMGGIDVDLNARTSVDRLYAAGECSHTGVHGANRLASNSLLEALVFARRAAQDITKEMENGNKGVVKGDMPKYSIGTVDLPKGIRTEIRSKLQDAYFVIKKPDKFEESYKRFDEILEDLENTDYKLTADYIEAKSLATVAQEIMLEVTRKHQEDY